MENDHLTLIRYFVIGALVITTYIIIVTGIGLIIPHEIPKKYGNLTAEEYQKKMLGTIPADTLNITPTESTDVPFEDIIQEGPIPAKFDWRDKGFVREVMDQGNYCPVCWGFSTFQLMESMRAIKNNNFKKLSVKHMWKTLPGMKECQMKNYIDVLNMMVEEHIAILTQECFIASLKHHTQCADRVGIRSFNRLKCPTSEEIMHIIAKHGPVLVLVNADTWRHYSGNGVINEGCSVCNKSNIVPTAPSCGCCRIPSPLEPALEFELPYENLVCSDPLFNHVAVIIGYDTTGEIPFYIVRCTWGEDFGDHGYVRVAMGGNMCGIETSVTYININEYH